ncbi:hypothetical protein [Desulfocurvus sp. DL9XJH121]
MGRFLQIRVSASTFRPEDVWRAWPRLSALAWPYPPVVAGPPAQERGVLELVATLGDRVRFELEQGELNPDFLSGIETAQALCADMDSALADWDAGRANSLSQEIEAALDDLERLAPEAPFVVSKPDADSGKSRSRRQEGGAAKARSGDSQPRGIFRFFKR